MCSTPFGIIGILTFQTDTQIQLATQGCSTPIKSAMTGNTPAWKEIQDTLHGKQNNVTIKRAAHFRFGSLFVVTLGYNIA